MSKRTRVLVAADKFKGTATASEVCEVIAELVIELGGTAVVQPMADGGEGTLEALGGANRTRMVSGPLGDPVEARWRLAGPLAVVEMAEASGLSLVGGAAGNDPMAASTAGTGELLDAAVQRGAKHIVVGLGGSATTDGGWGAVQSLHPVQRLRGVTIEVACDVTTKFTDAATVFGPQKGASPAQVKLLSRRLDRLVQIYRDEHGVDVADLPMAGAAGGLAGGLAAVGATLIQGFELVAETCDLGGQMEQADLVITGEGGVDASSFQGKVVGGIVDYAASFEVPAMVVAGQVAEDFEPPVPVVSLAASQGTEAALSDVAGSLRAALRVPLEQALAGS